MSDIQALILTSKGAINLNLFAKQTPITVLNFANLAKRNFYNNLSFHRVIQNFMIQGGCPVGIGVGDPGYKFEDEFIVDLTHNRPGILSMANSGPHSNGCQFFITHVSTPWLDMKHTIFGEVVDQSDQEVVLKIEQGDIIESITIQGDLTSLEDEFQDRLAEWNAILDSHLVKVEDDVN